MGMVKMRILRITSVAERENIAVRASLQADTTREVRG